MDSDEWPIYHYVKSQRPNPAPARDVSRRVGGKQRFHSSPDWANPILVRMAERGILETTEDGFYQLKPAPQNHSEVKRWIAPELAEILQASGKSFAGVSSPEQEDAYYDNL
jgi:hypothetical protein